MPMFPDRLLWRGRCSTFGGANDMGVQPAEGLALVTSLDAFSRALEMFVDPGAGSRARNLDPQFPYIACRWDYGHYPREKLLGSVVLVRAVSSGRICYARPVDWGPHERTGRVADLSPGLALCLGVVTDSTVEIYLPIF